MKNVLLTFALTALVFTSTLLYGFCAGKLERPPANYLSALR